MGKKSLYTHSVHQKSVLFYTAQQLLFTLNIPQCSWYINDHHSLVCHGQQCKITWRRTWKWGLLLECRECTVRCQHGLALWLRLYLAQRFFSVTTVPSFAVLVTGMWCSGQRRIPISRRSWNLIHHVWWLGWVWHQIMWLDLTFSMYTTANLAVLETWLKPQLRDRGLMDDGLQRDGHTLILLSLCTAFWTNVLQATGLAVVHLHFWHH